MKGKPVRKSFWRRVRGGAFACALAAVLCAVGASCRREGGIGSGAGGVGAPGAKAARPERIVSLSPSATEILYGVGAFERVVAVTTYCEYPPEVAKLPRVGGWSNPNMEQLAGLRPDLVIFSDSTAPFIKDKLEALGIGTLAIPSNTLDDAFTAIEQIGRAAGNEAEARRLADETRARVEEVRARTRDLPRRRVLVVVDRIPGTLRDIYTAARGSFISQLVEAAGGESVAPPAASGWGKMQKEAVVALDPEIIIDLMMQPTGGTSENTLVVWGELKQLRAVREGRVHTLHDSKLIHPSQFVGDAAHRFAELIHPEAFGEKR
jgi:iron complex transport system substrate-binding protein